MKRARSVIPLLISCLLVLAAVLLWRNPAPSGGPQTDPPPPPAPPNTDPPTPPERPALSSLADFPRWQDLNAWQSTITRSEFLKQMDGVFTVSSKWRDWFYVGETDVLIKTGRPNEHFRLRFAKPGLAATNPRPWRTAEELSPAPTGRPLEGLKIAIDPGHIGGRWAKIEERWFQVRQMTPVKEGDMTLLVAMLLKPRLEALGADVTLIREATEPVTSYRPESLQAEAKAIDPDSTVKLAERLFYRTAEIRARAALVNEVILPDLVICLHFNASSWNNPVEPTLTDKHHFHLILNGAYTDSEIALADQRYQLIRKILTGAHPQEAAIGESVASTFVKNTALPPYLYQANSANAVNVNGNPYLWARNLLANRLYDCPVVYLEPYVMNSTIDHARIQAGDYEGIRKVEGKAQPSIFREYADSVAEGLADYYQAHRPELE